MNNTYPTDEDVRYNSAEFCAIDYEGDELQLPIDVQDFVRVLLKNKYEVRMWYDGTTVVVEYAARERSLSDAHLEWVANN